MGTPSRLTQGLATQAKGTTLGSYPLPSPFRTSSTPTTYYQSGYTTATFSTDFFDGTDASNFTVTSAGTSTFAVTDGVGGIAVLTPPLLAWVKNWDTVDSNADGSIDSRHRIDSPLGRQWDSPAIRSPKVLCGWHL